MSAESSAYLAGWLAALAGRGLYYSGPHTRDFLRGAYDARKAVQS